MDQKYRVIFIAGNMVVQDGPPCDISDAISRSMDLADGTLTSVGLVIDIMIIGEDSYVVWRWRVGRGIVYPTTEMTEKQKEAKDLTESFSF